MFVSKSASRKGRHRVFFCICCCEHFTSPSQQTYFLCTFFCHFFWLLGVFGERFLVILGMFWALLGSLGACRGHSRGKPGFRCDFGRFLGSFLDSLGPPWEARGRTRTPQEGLQMPPQRLILDTLVAKRWRGQPEQVFG